MSRAREPLEAAERRRGSDGADYALQSRVVDFDPLEQRVTYEMRAGMWRDGELVREEEHTLHINLYFKNELQLLLERAGDRKSTRLNSSHGSISYAAFCLNKK